ncbi:MAG: type II toxin-antitoxin system PemK/MazF family toxin [Candidatus Aminicenantes bacterium]|nr:type II toxin-antitoxin system PemK/MazF family toxin [Candidatus Aminicenantes bacterium]
MKSVEVKIAKIGNSRGVRLPAEVLKRYRMDSIVLMEETAEGIVLRPSGSAVKKLSWEETAAEMAAEGEDWSDWESVVGDGLETVPWTCEAPKRVMEKTAAYRSKSDSTKKTVRRFEILWADMNPVRGAETAKSRPVVIVSRDDLNARLQTVVICPLTSRLHPHWKSRLQVVCAGRPAEIAVDQIRAISRSRLLKKIGSLSDGESAALGRLITEMYGE